MAFSSSKVRRTVVGNLRIEIHSFDAASTTTGTIATGLNSIEHVEINNLTGTRAGQTATPTGGNVALAGLTSSDKGTIIAYGR